MASIMRIIVLASLILLAGCTGNSGGGASTPKTAQTEWIEQERASLTKKEAEDAEHEKLTKNPYYMAHVQQAVDGNIYAPEGANAVESLLKARSAFSAPNEQIESAIQDLQPYVILGTEAAIKKGDAKEADRLLSVMKVMDETASSIPRLSEEITAMKSKKLQAR